MIAGTRLRAGSRFRARGARRRAGHWHREAVSADATILVRGDTMFGSRGDGHLRGHGVQFSLSMTRNTASRRDRRHPRGRMTPVRYPGAVEDPDTGP